MAESAAQIRQRKLHEAIVSARARRESPQEDKALEKVVSPPAESQPQESDPIVTGVAENRKRQQATAMKDAAEPTKPVARQVTKKPTKRIVPNSGRQPHMGGERYTYQRHVLFAIVSAFLVRLVAGGKLTAK
jgi:hypothetical protein